MLVNGQYAEAEVAFGDFLEKHPDAEQAADARFWFAFTLLARNNYRDAAQNFTSYLRANPQAPRAAEAQVRLGMALVGMSEDGQNDAAERRQRRLVGRHRARLVLDMVLEPHHGCGEVDRLER